MRQIVLKFVILICFVSHLVAAYPIIIDSDNFMLRQIDDLPQSEVNAIFEDSRGFVWFATLDGLFRYDGKNYKSYQIGSAEGSISSNMILSINEDSGGNIWVGTYGRGISKVDVSTDMVTNYPIRSLIKESLRSNDVVTIEIDRNDNIWIGNWHAIIRATLDKEDYTIKETKFFPLDDESRNANDYITKIHEDKRGNIWVGHNVTTRKLVGEQGDKLIFQTYEYAAQDITDYDENTIVAVADQVTLFKYEIGSEWHSTDVVMPLSHRAERVAKTEPDTFWVGGRSGISCVFKSPMGVWKIGKSYNHKSVPFEMPTNVVTALCESRGHQLWVGTRGGGIFTVTRNPKLFNSYPDHFSNAYIPNVIVKSLFESRDGNLWIGTEENGVVVQPKDETYSQNIKFITVNKGDNRAYAFEQTANGLVWIGTSHSVNLAAYDPRTLKPLAMDFNTQQIGFVFALKQSDDNTLWAGTYNRGLWRLELSDSGQITKADHFSVVNSKICSNTIRSLYIAKNGDLWIGTDVGINRIRRDDLKSAEPTFVNTLSDGSKLTLDDNYLLQISESSDGRVLFGTMGHGLAFYNPKDDTLSHITTDNGLKNNSVKSIVECYDDGCLWLSTNLGISKYNLKSGEIVNYDNFNGISDCEFSEVCGIKRSNGDFVFGNRKGIVVFRPEEIVASTITPDLYFTDLYVNHELVKPQGSYDDRVILKNTLSHTKNLVLTYDERNFSIGFVGINFLSPRGNRYLYMLEGLDEDWVEQSGEELLATYTNIREGHYVFRVKASNGDGVWSDSELALDIVVRPPLQRSSIAYVVYMLFFFLILYVAYWVVALIFRKRKEVFEAQMEQRKAEDLVQHKLEFFMNISHEFRTPLTLINIPLERLLTHGDSEKPTYKEGLSQIKHNVDMLLSLINQLLDFRKIESGNGQISTVCTKMSDYLREYFKHFNPLAERNNIHYTFNCEEEYVLVDIDRSLFEKVAVNLLSNAFKYTQPGGAIEVKLSKDVDRDVAIISVKDNGRGVSKEEIPYLFDRFYQGENKMYLANGISGSGIGLSLCKNIVELHGGTISARSDLNQGFEVVIELKMSHGIAQEVSDECHISKDSINVVEGLMYEDKQIVTSGRSGEDRGLILIVEDNDQLRNGLEKLLQSDYDIVTAADGEAGLKQCFKCKPTLIITDIMMPKMNGIEMCRQIKQSEEISHTPIMVLSADTSIKNQIDSFTIGGADGYLDKPFSVEVLKSKIEAILNNRELLKRRFNEVAIVNPEAIARTPADLKYLSRIISIIKDNMSNSELSIEFIAQEYGVSRTYLNRKIKALTGETSTHFLRNIRLKYAAKLILQKGMTISEVAWAVGYSDVNTFRIRFKETFGVSPTQYTGEPAINCSNNLDDDLLL